MKAKPLGALRRAATSQGGIALLEVLISAVLFAFCTLGLTNSILNTRKTSDSSRQASEAAMLAYDKLEMMRTLPEAQIPAGSFSETLSTSGGSYTRSWVVTTDTPLSGMRTVEITVSWRERKGVLSTKLVGYVML